jgi:hypothetical protein
MLVILLGVVLGSIVSSFAKRESPSNPVVVASCLLAGVVAALVLWIGTSGGMVGMLVFWPLGLAYAVHPLAVQGMVRQPKSVLPFLVSCVASGLFLYFLFHPN